MVRNNFFIKSNVVVLLDENRQSLGVMPSGKAKDIANTKNIQLVLVNGAAVPPVYALGDGPVDTVNSATVRLLDSNRQMIGVIPVAEARKIASDRGEDLIILNSKVDPNVCQLGDKSKFEYERKKAAKENEKKQRAAAKNSSLKELKLPADTSDSSKGDRTRLYAQASEFISEGHPVKLSVRFRGRMMSHAREVMDRLREEASDAIGNATLSAPSATGNVFTMMCTPAKKQ